MLNFSNRVVEMRNNNFLLKIHGHKIIEHTGDKIVYNLTHTYTHIHMSVKLEKYECDQ